MYCVKCGIQLPDDANFCLKCGAAQRPGVTARESDAQYEICEIASERIEKSFRSQRWVLVAHAVGPTGRRLVSTSSEIPVPGSYGGIDFTTLAQAGDRKLAAAAQVALDGLLTELTGAGWEPLPSGPWWYSYRFHRRVS